MSDDVPEGFRGLSGSRSPSSRRDGSATRRIREIPSLREDMQVGVVDHIAPPNADLATNLSPRVPKVTLLTLPHVRVGHKRWFRPAEHGCEKGGPAEQAHEAPLPTPRGGSGPRVQYAAASRLAATSCWNEQCMSEYDLDGWTAGPWSKPTSRYAPASGTAVSSWQANSSVAPTRSLRVGAIDRPGAHSPVGLSC
jgi:hypothetical protein